jgi:hypothetical protein
LGARDEQVAVSPPESPSSATAVVGTAVAMMAFYSDFKPAG